MKLFMYNLIRMSILKLTSIDSWEIMKKILINSPNNLHLHYDRGAHETSERWFFFHYECVMSFRNIIFFMNHFHGN